MNVQQRGEVRAERLNVAHPQRHERNKFDPGAISKYASRVCSSFQTLRGQLRIERTVSPAGPETVRLQQHFHGDDTRVIVTHEAALLAIVEVQAGQLSFPLASEEIVAPRRFALSLPPRSVLPIRFARAEVNSEGLGKIGEFGQGDAAVYALQPGARLSPVLLAGQRLALLRADARVPAAIVRARNLLHASLARRAPVRAVAGAIGIHPETFSRAFAGAYAVTPKQYCQRARLFDAAIRLYCGTPLAAAAFCVGFNDLRRFYAQFRRLLGSTPGSYARMATRERPQR